MSGLETIFSRYIQNQFYSSSNRNHNNVNVSEQNMATITGYIMDILRINKKHTALFYLREKTTVVCRIFFFDGVNMALELVTDVEGTSV